MRQIIFGKNLLFLAKMPANYTFKIKLFELIYDLLSIFAEQKSYTIPASELPKSHKRATRRMKLPKAIFVWPFP